MREVLRTQGLPWSTAIAAGAMLRIRLARFASRLAEGEAIDVAAGARDGKDFLAELDHTARREGDPFLLSDAKLLRIAWGVLARDGVNLHALCEDLAATLEGAPALTLLLRAVEVARWPGRSRKPAARSPVMAALWPTDLPSSMRFVAGCRRTRCPPPTSTPAPG